MTTRPMTIAIALVIALGGIVIPFVGWIAGICMMWVSSIWTRTEKIITTLAPLLAAGISTLITFAVTDSSLALAISSWGLVPLAALMTGIWLLVVGLRRTAS